MERIFHELARDRMRALQYVPTRDLIVQPQHGFTIWWQLERMEQERLVVSRHVPGQGDYWRASMMAGAVYRTLFDKWKRRRCAIPTADIAADLGKVHRVVQRELVKLEHAGIIQRRGQRGGWMPVVRNGHERILH